MRLRVGIRVLLSRGNSLLPPPLPLLLLLLCLWICKEDVCGFEYVRISAQGKFCFVVGSAKVSLKLDLNYWAFNVVLLINLFSERLLSPWWRRMWLRYFEFLCSYHCSGWVELKFFGFIVQTDFLVFLKCQWSLLFASTNFNENHNQKLFCHGYVVVFILKFYETFIISSAKRL